MDDSARRVPVARCIVSAGRTVLAESPRAPCSHHTTVERRSTKKTARADAKSVLRTKFTQVSVTSPQHVSKCKIRRQSRTCRAAQVVSSRCNHGDQMAPPRGQADAYSQVRMSFLKVEVCHGCGSVRRWRQRHLQGDREVGAGRARMHERTTGWHVAGVGRRGHSTLAPNIV